MVAKSVLSQVLEAHQPAREGLELDQPFYYEHDIYLKPRLLHSPAGPGSFACPCSEPGAPEAKQCCCGERVASTCDLYARPPGLARLSTANLCLMMCLCVTARPTAGASGTGGETLEMGCGGVEGGMTSTLTWMESVNSTMDEAKTLVVKQQVM